jgi:ubiquinone/menaquinone biosynthesis C-methylase UbiE
MATPSAAYKQAAIEQWTADPCEQHSADGAPGTREYFYRLLKARDAYAGWLRVELGYQNASGRRVLDVGCGQGIDVANYALAGAQITGVDLTPRHVELARTHLAALGLTASIVRGDAESLPFASADFDRVVSNGVLHHTPDFPAALREIRRVLRPGGTATIIVYHQNSLHYWVNQVLLQGVLERQLFREGSMERVLSRNVEFSRIDAQPLVRVYTRRDVRRLMAAAGFASVRTRVHQFKLEDAFLIAWLSRAVPPLRRVDLQERIGRLAGWYVVGHGRAA